MLNLYTSPSCASCRKVKKYFDAFNIEYVEKNILGTKLTREDIYKMLINSENGFEDIISTRSKIIKENNIDFDSMKVSEAVDFIIANPTVLKRPIIVAPEDMQVGYNNEDISIFLPQELRKFDCEICEVNKDIDFEKILREN